VSEKNTGGPAFASHALGIYQSGMTLRDYFAGQALIALIAQDTELMKINISEGRDYDHDEDITDAAYYFADDMIESRK